MIRFKIGELIEKKEFRENRRITIGEIATETKINRMTISKIMNHRGYSTVTENLDRLCEYFACKIEDLIEHVPNSEVEN